MHINMIFQKLKVVRAFSFVYLTHSQWTVIKIITVHVLVF